jgi:enoyl-CoA hydratase
MSDDGRVTLDRAGPVARITFDRPAARNAMTWAMYEDFGRICDTLADDPEIRVAVFRGAGGRAFIAGTDISQFSAFGGAVDGVAYEASIDAYLGKLAALPFPTLAAIEGWAVGGGLAIATVCDIRIATPDSRFGVPIARTVGNCLSMATLRRLLGAIGASRAKRILMLGEFLTAEEAREAGFLSRVVDAEQLDAEIDALAETIAGNAPITLRVTKAGIERIEAGDMGAGIDLIEAAYGSEDFRLGVEAFTSRRTPEWKGK